IAFIENIFPPSPSDVMIVAAGSLVGAGTLGFPETLLVATAGSTLGFLAMYKIGDWFGDHILEEGKIRFIPVESVKKVEAWFKRYGYWIIVANRFLAGTRAVVSFFAGMSELNLAVTSLLCLVSALAWNAILVSGGYALGNNWEQITLYLTSYSQIVTGVVIVVLLLLIAKYLYNRNNRARAGD
ncbi:MAG: DedA family protein, partial [Bacteroidetes bacterium]|nr:DedA family protein [Bacteroidota bacterium]